MRNTDGVIESMQSLTLYVELSQYALQRRRNLATVTKPLCDHNISYSWNYPAKLQITHNDETFNVKVAD